MIFKFLALFRNSTENEQADFFPKLNQNFFVQRPNSEMNSIRLDGWTAIIAINEF